MEGYSTWLEMCARICKKSLDDLASLAMLDGVMLDGVAR